MAVAVRRGVPSANPSIAPPTAGGRRWRPASDLCRRARPARPLFRNLATHLCRVAWEARSPLTDSRPAVADFSHSLDRLSDCLWNPQAVTLFVVSVSRSPASDLCRRARPARPLFRNLATHLCRVAWEARSPLTDSRPAVADFSHSLDRLSDCLWNPQAVTLFVVSVSRSR